MDDLKKQNQLLQDQIRALIAKLHERDPDVSKSSVNDQSSFFSAFKSSQSRSKLMRDVSKKDFNEMGLTIKKLNEEKEQLRLALKNQSDAFQQRINQKDEEIEDLNNRMRQLQLDYKEIQTEHLKLAGEIERLKNQPKPQEEVTIIKATKTGLLSLPCLIVIRKNLYDNPIVEVETAQDKYTILVHDIQSLKPDRNKQDIFTISYKYQAQTRTDTYQSAETKKICKILKQILQNLPPPQRKTEQPEQQANGGGLIKSLSALFSK
ncbi:hypothetical protein pb186bvf_007498 [Paramecium bursaria]